MRNLDAALGIEPAELVRVDEMPLPKHLVREGDIIFRSRAVKSFDGTLIDFEPNNVIVASPLIVITPQQNKVLPAYLNWFINQHITQSHFQNHAKGTAVRMVGKKALEALLVKLPSLGQQAAIVKLVSLAAEEQRLLRVLGKKRKQYMEDILMQMASKPQR
ncbi:hypothetical protein MNBD_GAMMA26-1406 [hydrothermal vent metagenome]|uniref:Type I restriction modification DNA specificity domain-containing protein n=1 Tax=hydrothermal vent metagenome TaxID=652676 RepID=A0A3B1B6S6_9ZZZZ